MRRTLVLLAAAVAAAVLLAPSNRSGPPEGEVSGTVVRVVDGDTVRVRVGGREERVRYIGVDTPELRDGAPECYARRAREQNARLVAGRRVRLVLDVEERDRFGRLLAYVNRRDDGRFVNAALVAGGFARTLTVPPNVRFADRLAALAREARRAGRGLWAACDG